MLMLKVLDPAADHFFPQLTAKLRQAPGLFRGAPVVLDLSETANLDSLDLPQFLEELRKQNLSPVGVQGGSALVQEAAQRIGLSVISGGRATRLEEPAPAPVAVLPAPPPPPPAPVRATMTVTDPVRSGRRIYSRGDLVVLAPVSQGAELLADGHIHIYGALRGRALAGLNGDTSARIFCQSLQAELVSIAGLYKVMDDIDRTLMKKSVHIHLEADRLRIDLLS